MVGSQKDVDDCGICGGDGTYCKRNSTKDVFSWEVQWTLCSVSCGVSVLLFTYNTAHFLNYSNISLQYWKTNTSIFIFMDSLNPISS